MTKYVYLIVTVKTSTRYPYLTVDARQVIKEPKALKINELAYRLKIEIDENKWKKRAIEVALPQIDPPELPEIHPIEEMAAPSTEMQVYDTLRGDA